MGPHTVASAVPYYHEAADAMSAQQKRLSKLLHNEAHRASTGATTTRNPILGAHTARVVERARKQNTITKTHSQSNLSGWMGWHAIVNPCRTVSYEVNAFLLQHALNRLNIPLILAGDANVTLDLAVTVLKNFELERNTIQAENYMPAR